MPTFLERYQDGQRREVWRDLIQLGAAVRDPQHWPDAEAVSRETMLRARDNVEVLIRRLDRLGYRFYTKAAAADETLSRADEAMRMMRNAEAMSQASGGQFPMLHLAIEQSNSPEMQAKMSEMMAFFGKQKADPSADALDDEYVWTKPTAEVRQGLAGFEESIGGPLPLSLRAWCEHVGSVSLMGSHEVLGQRAEANFDFDPFDHARAPHKAVEERLADPLVVTPDFSIEDEEWEDEDEEAESSYPLEISLAPDEYHKAAISGGGPYGMIIPNPAADGIFSDWHKGYFVDYLRTAFRWGGFPGLARYENQPKEIAYLAQDLQEI